jgi:hypothetical protein
MAAGPDRRFELLGLRADPDRQHVTEIAELDAHNYPEFADFQLPTIFTGRLPLDCGRPRYEIPAAEPVKR